MLLCHSSYRGVIECLRDRLDTLMGLGTVHNLVQASVTRAQPMNVAQDRSRARTSTHDELFQASQPVLTGIDLDSLYGDRLAAEPHRDAETWAIHLLDLAAQGWHPNDTLADGARGLRAGQALAWPDVPGSGAVFHALRGFTKIAHPLEKCADAGIAKRTALERDRQKAPEQKHGQWLSTTRAQESVSIRLGLRRADPASRVSPRCLGTERAGYPQPNRALSVRNRRARAP